MCCAVLSCSVVSDSLWLHGLQPARLLCPWGFSRQEYWSGLPYPPPGNLPNPGIKLGSPALPADFYQLSYQGSPNPVIIISYYYHNLLEAFLGGSVGKESACNVGDPGSIPGWGRSLGEGNGNPLQYSCLENPIDRGTWSATVHGVAKSWTWLSN